MFRALTNATVERGLAGQSRTFAAAGAATGRLVHKIAQRTM